MGRRVTHTIDSQRLIEFAQKYPNRWRTYKDDARTRKAVLRAWELHKELKIDENFKMFKYVDYSPSYTYQAGGK